MEKGIPESEIDRMDFLWYLEVLVWKMNENEEPEKEARYWREVRG